MNQSSFAPAPGVRVNGTPDKAVLQQAYDLCVTKTRRNIAKLADEPKTWSFNQDGDYSRWPEGFFEIGNWTSSFFTGMALLALESTKDFELLRQINRMSGIYAEKVDR